MTISPIRRWSVRWPRWCADTYGEASFKDVKNRGARVAEEGIELAQAAGVTRETVIKIVERAYSRPKGEVRQEVAGVFITLIIFCQSQGVNLLRNVAVEWQRVNKKGASYFRDKHLEKFAAGTDLIPPP